MQIVSLSDFPQHLDVVAQWLWDEWHGQYAAQTFEQVRSTLLDKPGCPPALIALDGEPLGAIVFRRIKFRGREPLLLFVNALYVPLHARERGVATALLTEGLARVGKEHAAVHVYTQIRAWYEARGFTVIEEDSEPPNVVLSRANPNAG